MALTNEAWKGLKQLYPTTRALLDYRLEANANEAPVLAWWNDDLGAKPTDAAIMAAVGDYDTAEGVRETARQAERQERTQVQALDAALTDYLALASPTAAQTQGVVRLLVRAARWQLRHLPEM